MLAPVKLQMILTELKNILSVIAFDHNATRKA
jgi:hypothetical protein